MLCTICKRKEKLRKNIFLYEKKKRYGKKTERKRKKRKGEMKRKYVEY
jgi:hypothetical protein